MGIQDRDYYREHHRQQQLVHGNEQWLQANSISARTWFFRLFLVLLLCAVVYLVFEVVRLRKELGKAERVVQQLTEQMRHDRQRAAQRVVPAPQRPSVEFFNR